ncbi:LOW QUALITY PROTEIN: U3 small nucleolar ribonucleoprotein protein IMP3, partial [Copidosoma floridanum]|uniref:LOW QUALITY PROTEIN: U3 small nucleolar ribonucleoprotein protein IMP3 n=1 Tax=Copidosoma floridanum TaxID=29053 RepID=UPI000C6F67FF
MSFKTSIRRKWCIASNTEQFTIVENVVLNEHNTLNIDSHGWLKYMKDATSEIMSHLVQKSLIPTKWDLSLCQKVTASSFCRRRLPVIMVRCKMSENIKMATQLIEQGHVRVGPEVIKDPAFLVTRNLEDFVTWTDTSAIKKHTMNYNST